jgi:ribosomal protein S19E (S16A)
MTNPEWITGAPRDARSLRVLESLERRGLVQCRSGRWSITPAGRAALESLDARSST